MGGICEITNIIKQANNRDATFGYLGDWRPPAAVLFERESLQGNTKPSRKKREEVASNVEGSVGEAGDVSCVGGNLSPTVTSKWMKGYGGPSGSNETGNMVYAPTVIDRAAFNQGENAQYEPRIEEGETMSSLVAKGPHAVAQPISIDAECNARTNQFGTLVRGGEGGTQQFVAQPIAIQDVRPIEKAQNGRGWNDDGTSYTIDTKATQGVAQPIAVDTYNYTTNDHTTQTIRSQSDTEHIGAVLQPIAIDWRTAQVDQGITQTLKTDLAKMSGPCIAVDTFNQTINERTSQTIGSSASDVNHYGAVLRSIDFRNNRYNEEQIAGTLQSKESGGYSLNYTTGVHQPPMAIRRLTPKECERLQGFPDDWTKIPYRNKEADQCPDGPRYKACGNSMAVPVMRWIGQRIQYVENLMKEL